MQTHHSTLILSLGFALSAAALTPDTKPNTPKQPWSDYVVHDGTRPKPVKVAAAAATTTPAPSDATVLFGGNDSSAFTKNWRVKDGILIASPGTAESKASFGDCQLHLEWRIPAGREVHNQSGGNSGVFLMGLYEIQIQESHSNVTYADGQAGAIYGQTPPRVNPSLPQGEWQSYDILFTAPRYHDGKLVSPAYLTVLHNGVMIHNHQEVYGPTVFRKLASYPAQHPVKAPLKLQWHGDPIEFRNIWVRPISK